MLDLHTNDVLKPALFVGGAAVLDRRHLFAALNYPFGEKKSDSEFCIVARRSHGYRDALRRGSLSNRRADLDLQRLFDGNVVGLPLLPIAADLADVDGKA